MTIVGFTFSKMLATKDDGAKGKINISNNVSITDIKETKLSFSSNEQKGINFNFKFSSKYEPNVGEISLEGSVLYMAAAAEAKNIVDGWKKDKKVDKNLMQNILNHVLTKCNIQALILSKDIALPPPIPLPKVGEKK